MLRAASDGNTDARSLFAGNYAGPVRAYLGHRWRGNRMASAIDDAVQDVFVECMKPGGVLERADPEKGDFRALLYGVARNVARRHEKGVRRPDGGEGGSVYLDELPGQEAALSRVFDRAWAEGIVQDAVLRHARAARAGDAGMRFRYRVLRLRHRDGLPVREIAEKLEQDDVESVHNAYRRARREFRTHFRAAVTQHTGAAPEVVDLECQRVSSLLAG